MKKLTTLSLAIAATGMMASQSASAQLIAQETFTYFNLPKLSFSTGIPSASNSSV